MGLRSFIAARLARAPDPPAERAAAAGPAAETRGAAGAFGGTLVFLGAAEAGEGAERGYQTLASRGFMQNPVVYRCLRLVAESVAAVPWLLYAAEREIPTHPLLDLLARPGGGEDGRSLVERLCGHLLLSGNAFLERLSLDGAPRELHALRPDRVRVIAGRDGWPEAYEYRVGAHVRRLAVGDGGEAAAGPPLLHLKLFHPLADATGFAPLGAAGAALDLHNAAARWNRALLENSARPSGALVYAPGDASNLSPDQFDRLRAELDSGYTGAARAGRPMLLEGGLDWKPMGLSPKEMDFIEARNQAAREIALAFGVPPMLLGLPGDNTYANLAEANRAFFRLSVLPLSERLAGAIGAWLGTAFGEPRLRLAPDADAIPALGQEREALWARIGAATFLTEAEKRAAVGYGRAG